MQSLVEGDDREEGGREAGREIHEVLGLVVVTNTDIEPGAVVVHLQDTPPAPVAVVGPGNWTLVRV